MQTRLEEMLWQPMEKPIRLHGAERAVAAWVTLEEHERVLDLACGDGALLSVLAGKYRLRVCGICESAEQAHAVRGRLDEADVLAARPMDIPWRDNAFDAVLSAKSAFQYEDFDKVLEEIIRVLRPGGQLVLSAPFSLDEGSSPRNLMRRLQQAGFENVSWRMHRLNGVCIAWKRGALKEN